jgi:hypothetical protein
VGQHSGVDLFGGPNGMGGNMNMGQSNGHVPCNDVEFRSQHPHRLSLIISFGSRQNMLSALEASYGWAKSGLSASSID